MRIHALNLGERLRGRFEHLFAAAGRGAGLLVNEAVADVVLVDMDAADAAQTLEQYRRRNPRRPALILARTPPEAGAHDRVLLKPVVIRDLLGALAQLREVVDPPATAVGDPVSAYADTVVNAPGTATATGSGSDTDWGEDEEPPTMVLPRGSAHSKPTGGDPPAAPLAAAPESTSEMEDPTRWAELCGTGEDVDADDQEAVEALWLRGDGLLLPRLAAAARQALDEQRVLELHAGTLKIVLDGASDYAYADSDEATVRALCAAGRVEADMSVTPAGKPKAVLLSRSGNPTAHWPTVESAVWQAALWTYRGRLPAGTSIVERVYLSRWPNFTRLAELPRALRIAALWVEQPLSLAATAALLGLPQRYVFALYGAAHALGLSGPARRGADHLFETSPAMLVPRRPLLGRLVRHLQARTVRDDTAPSRAAG